MDPLTLILHTIILAIAHLPDATAMYLIRANLFFGVTTLTAACAFHQGSRSLPIQSLAATLGLLFGAFLPVGWILDTPPFAKGSVLILAIVILAFIPRRLPFYLTPNQVTQTKIRRGSYKLLIGLFVLSFL